MSGKKSDHGDAVTLADILRTDADQHRRLPADTELAQSITVLARAHQDATCGAAGRQRTAVAAADTDPGFLQAQVDSAACHQAELYGRMCVYIAEDLGLHKPHVKAVRTCHRILGQPVHSDGWCSHRTLMTWRLLSAIMLLVMGGIHLYLVFDGVGGSLGMLFVLNAVGALVLAIAIIVLRGRLLSLATGLSLLFMVGTLLALVLALTVGLFGIHQVLSFKLVPTTLVVESIGTMILAVTVALVLRSRRAP